MLFHCQPLRKVVLDWKPPENARGKGSYDDRGTIESSADKAAEKKAKREKEKEQKERNRKSRNSGKDKDKDKDTTVDEKDQDDQAQEEEEKFDHDMLYEMHLLF